MGIMKIKWKLLLAWRQVACSRHVGFRRAPDVQNHLEAPGVVEGYTDLLESQEYVT